MSSLQSVKKIIYKARWQIRCSINAYMDAERILSSNMQSQPRGAAHRKSGVASLRTFWCGMGGLKLEHLKPCIHTIRVFKDFGVRAGYSTFSESCPPGSHNLLLLKDYLIVWKTFLFYPHTSIH